MATFNELAVLIAEPLGRALDDPFKEQIKARIKYWRAKLLRDTLNKNPKDRAFFTQKITMKLEEVPAADCGIPLSCTVLRTVDKVPAGIRANNILFDFVGAIDGTTPFKYIHMWELPYKLQERYSPIVTSHYAYENEYIIVPKKKILQYVRVERIFDDPEAAAELSCTATGVSCAFDDEEYPISEDLAQQIVQYILQVDFNRKPTNDDTVVNLDDDDKNKQ
jgi:hypothetical protein